jgi:hypothetical protein
MSERRRITVHLKTPIEIDEGDWLKATSSVANYVDSALPLDAVRINMESDPLAFIRALAGRQKLGQLIDRVDRVATLEEHFLQRIHDAIVAANVPPLTLRRIKIIFVCHAQPHVAEEWAEKTLNEHVSNMRIQMRGKLFKVSDILPTCFTYHDPNRRDNQYKLSCVVRLEEVNEIP